MNLPQSAYEFVDVFIGYHHRYAPTSSPLSLPRIHVYAFSTASDPIEDVVQRVASVMQCTMEDMNYHPTDSSADDSDTKKRSRDDDKQCRGYIVRDVAPRKVMICLSFTLPISVATATPTRHA